MLNKEQLINIGVDYYDGLNRFSGNQGMYEKYLMKFPQDPSFDALKDALDNMDVTTAFKSAHTLKGVAGNLSLKDLLEPLKPMVDCLRVGDIDGAMMYKGEVEIKYNAIVSAINNQDF